MDSKFSLGILVANRAGVLTRITSLFSRRGFNIDSLSVCETENPKFSRMTITASGDDYIKEQLVKQLYKLIDVKKVSLMDNDKTVFRELLLMKVSTQGAKRSEIMELVSIYGAGIVDVVPDSMTIELTGEPIKVSAFIENMRPYEIVELCRSGASAIERGSTSFTKHKTTKIRFAEAAGN